MIIERKLYLHRDKDSNWGLWEKVYREAHPESAAGATGHDAGRRFAYTALEVEVDVCIDTENGRCIATHFMGQPLPEKVDL